MVNRSTSNKSNEVAKPSPTLSPEGNTVKRNEGEVTPLDTTPTSEPLAEQPDDKDEDTLS